ncbi:MAG: prolyl oligopeptidase family serine peptidase, partial [Myxococcota bacterium]
TFSVASVGPMIRTPDRRIVFGSTSYVDPGTWFRFDPQTRDTTALTLDDPPPVDLDGVTVVREMATSVDGTKVPANILLPPGVERNGENPCIVTGYGGYGISLSPGFRPDYAPLLRRGVIVVVANLRGGGEFGEAWHEQGALENKQNVFDDFTAVLDHLVARGYTKPERTGIMGGSNGGLLMGAVLTQHPEKLAAVMGAVGIYDMIRVENSANGAFNVTEFGTVKDEAQFRALYAYSPYHRVEDGTAYPPVLLTTGANDPRVLPMQSRKMAARLQAAQGGSAPILLRTSADAGHGAGTPLGERIALRADQFAFLLHHIGAPVQPTP